MGLTFVPITGYRKGEIGSTRMPLALNQVAGAPESRSFRRTVVERRWVRVGAHRSAIMFIVNWPAAAWDNESRSSAPETNPNSFGFLASHPVVRGGSQSADPPTSARAFLLAFQKRPLFSLFHPSQSQRLTDKPFHTTIGGCTRLLRRH